MQNWLVISNFQTFGLTKSLNLLAVDIKVEPLDVWSFKANIDHYSRTFSKYDRVIIHPLFQGSIHDFSDVENLSRIPSIKFDAYHPDICFATVRGVVFDGPLGAYHSMIVLAAFQAGLSIEKTLKLFRADFYEKSGFYTRWEGERERLMNTFMQEGLDISEPFRTWSRGESFMYGIDHSKARPIHDIARVYLEHNKIQTNDTDIIPADVSNAGACFPVYPEVGEVLGVDGSYMFKLPQDYRLIPLERFIELSFEVYAKHPSESLSTEWAFLDRFNLVKTLIEDAWE